MKSYLQGRKHRSALGDPKSWSHKTKSTRKQQKWVDVVNTSPCHCHAWLIRAGPPAAITGALAVDVDGVELCLDIPTDKGISFEFPLIAPVLPPREEGDTDVTIVLVRLLDLDPPDPLSAMCIARLCAAFSDNVGVSSDTVEERLRRGMSGRGCTCDGGNCTKTGVSRCEDDGRLPSVFLRPWTVVEERIGRSSCLASLVAPGVCTDDADEAEDGEGGEPSREDSDDGDRCCCARREDGLLALVLATDPRRSGPGEGGGQCGAASRK